MNLGVGFIVGLVLVTLFLFFIIPAQASLNSPRVIVPFDMMTSLFVAWESTSTFWIMVTALGMAGATFAVIKDRRDEGKARSHLS